jgi:hypothetical protein
MMIIPGGTLLFFGLSLLKEINLTDFYINVHAAVKFCFEIAQYQVL